MPVPILSEAGACSGTWQPLRGSLQLSMPVVLIFLCPCFLLRHSLARFGSFTRFELGGSEHKVEVWRTPEPNHRRDRQNQKVTESNRRKYVASPVLIIISNQYTS